MPSRFCNARSSCPSRIAAQTNIAPTITAGTTTASRMSNTTASVSTPQLCKSGAGLGDGVEILGVVERAERLASPLHLVHRIVGAAQERGRIVAAVVHRHAEAHG